MWIEPVAARLLQAIELPASFVRLSNAVLRTAARKYPDHWRLSKMTDDEIWALSAFQKAQDWALHRHPVSETQEKMFLADLEETDEVKSAFEKERARNVVLEWGWRDLKNFLYEQRITGYVFQLDGRHEPVPARCWFSPLLGRDDLASYKTSLLLLRMDDDRTVKGLGAMHEADFQGDFLDRWSASSLSEDGNSDGPGVADPSSQETDQPRPACAARPRRRGAPSLAADDAPAIAEMHRLLTDGTAKSVTAAAGIVRAQMGVGGFGSDESRVKRLERRYREQFGSK